MHVIDKLHVRSQAMLRLLALEMFPSNIDLVATSSHKPISATNLSALEYIVTSVRSDNPFFIDTH